jgi:hypothetical protein
MIMNCELGFILEGAVVACLKVYCTGFLAGAEERRCRLQSTKCTNQAEYEGELLITEHRRSLVYTPV